MWNLLLTYLKLGWQFALVCWHLFPHLSITPCCTLHAPQCKIQDDHCFPLAVSTWCWLKCLCFPCNWVRTMDLGLLDEQREHFKRQFTSNRPCAWWRLEMCYINVAISGHGLTNLHSGSHWKKHNTIHNTLQLTPLQCTELGWGTSWWKWTSSSSGCGCNSPHVNCV